MSATDGASVYARLSDAPVHHTVDVGAANIDYAEDGTPVGVEVLNAIGISIDGDPIALEDPCDECLHARSLHADEMGKCSVGDCHCKEWWSR